MKAKFNLAKIDELGEFINEITTDAVEVAQKVLSICQRLKSKLVEKKDSSNGVLKRAYHLYSNCFSVKLAELNQLFDEDMADWKRELSASMGDGVNYMANLHMLPLFGKQIPESEVDFKFPNDDLFMHMNGMQMDRMEVKLSSISLRGSYPRYDRIDGI